MRSLFIGNIDIAAKEVIKYFDNQDDKKNNDVYRNGKLNIKKLFISKDYDNVYYFSKGINDEFNDVNEFLQIVNNSNNVKKFIYIIRSNNFNIETKNEKIEILKEIFSSYAKKQNKKIILLNTSCLYSNEFIDGKINNIKKLNKYENESGNYIHIEDFSRFLYLLGFHKINENYVEFKSNTLIKIKQLFTEDKIKKVTIKIKNLFNFKFEHSIVNDINNGLNIKNILKNETISENDNPIINILEVILMFIISEILVNKFNSIFNIQYVDFRLIYMVIIAIYYKFKYSMIATCLVITSFIFTNINNSQDLSYIFSNTDNWLNIIIYIIMTILIRTKIEKFELNNKNNNEKILKLKEDKKNRERNLKKYEIKIKELNKELLTHDNSFTKVANIINNYNSINKENVYKIFLETFNDENIIIFDNKDNSVYPTNTKNKLTISKINKLVAKKKIWINKELVEELPLYIIPIYENNNISYFTTIWSYDLNIVNNEFKNNLISLSNIISSIKDSDKE